MCWYEWEDRFEEIQFESGECYRRVLGVNVEGCLAQPECCFDWVDVVERCLPHSHLAYCTIDFFAAAAAAEQRSGCEWPWREEMVHEHFYHHRPYHECWTRKIHPGTVPEAWRRGHIEGHPRQTVVSLLWGETDMRDPGICHWRCSFSKKLETRRLVRNSCLRLGSSGIEHRCSVFGD